MRWIFVIAGVVFAVIAIMMATEIPRLMDFKDKFRELDQKINTADLGDKILKSQTPIDVSTNANSTSASTDSEPKSTSEQQESVSSKSTDSPNMDVDESMK
jgi:hypothetical protein